MVPDVLRQLYVLVFKPVGVSLGRVGKSDFGSIPWVTQPQLQRSRYPTANLSLKSS